MAATRARIVEAAFQLHATVGPGRTSIAAIADRAGVQRHTVYRHFADVNALYEACTRHGMASTGMPDATSWGLVTDPVQRLELGLAELFRWYQQNERMLMLVLADEGPDTAAPEDPYSQRMSELAAALIAPWAVPHARRATFEAFVRHAIEFATWRSLHRGGLTGGDAVTLLAGIARAIVDGALP